MALIWNEAEGKIEERSKLYLLYYSLQIDTDVLIFKFYPSYLLFNHCHVEIFAYQADLKGHQLPKLKRRKGESDVFGVAAQAFNVPSDYVTMMPGFISGNLVLPPKGIKDAEGVGVCAQVFNIIDCQPKSVEIAIADPEVNEGKFEPASAQRYLLSKGEMFHVPPGNVYRVENHSTSKECTLCWTIIRPMNPRSQDK